MKRMPQTRADLERHLDEQLSFLRTATVAHEKLMAGTIRLLAHDEGRSKSLLGQLGLKMMAFHDGGLVPDPRNLAPTAGLTGFQLTPLCLNYVPRFSHRGVNWKP